jgi:hypothetical protein
MSDSNFQKRDLSPDDLIEINNLHILRFHKLQSAIWRTISAEYQNLQTSFDKILKDIGGLTSTSHIISGIFGLDGRNGIEVQFLKADQVGWRLARLKVKLEFEIYVELDPNDPLIINRVKKIVDEYCQKYPGTVSRKDLVSLLNSLIAAIPGKELPIGKTVHSYLNTLLNSFKQGKPEELIEADKNQVVHKALEKILAILTENTPENPSPDSSNDTIEGEIIETETSPLDDIRKTLNQTLNP